MNGSVEEIDVRTAEAMWRAGDVVVDVRAAEEYAAGHIAGAVHVPLDRIAFVHEELPAGQVIAVCSMGNRSRRGAETFARLGRTAYTLRGGTKAWAAAGLPVVAGPEPGAATRPGPWQRLRQRLRRRSG